MPDPDSDPRVPPVTVISVAIKLVEDSLRVKVKVAVSPDFKVVLSEAIVMVGAVVSTVTENCVAAVLLLPTASVKVAAATLKVAVVVLFAVGVNTAV